MRIAHTKPRGGGVSRASASTVVNGRAAFAAAISCALAERMFVRMSSCRFELMAKSANALRRLRSELLRDGDELRELSLRVAAGDRGAGTEQTVGDRIGQAGYV